MKNSILILLVTLLGGISLSFTSLPSNTGRWEHLGSKKVDYKLDRDRIHVGAHDGAFDKLKIEVAGGSLNMHKMIVEYHNGTREEISIKHHFVRGDESRIIDLRRGKRLIKDITFWYDSKNIQPRKAVVNVYGRH
ncbi:MAG: hypothetical protein KDC53_22120 [Saprospiraceae bacterium]|nr:hypothetical protein [Saprospiraceae bacterium]